MLEMLPSVRNEIRGAWRYRWQANIVAWTVCVLGWIGVYTIPDIFEARAQVYVDAESRLAKVVGQVGAAPGIGARVFVVRQAMLGRPQLERVARDTDLDLRARTVEEKEELILGLRDKIRVSTGRTRQAQNLYTITFKDRDRDTAIAVVQTLLNTFVEDVLELKEQGTDEVTGYLDDQLSYYSNLLSEAELNLANFKKKYVGLLPGESGGIFERLQEEIELLGQFRLDLQIETDRRQELRRQLRTEVPYLPDDGTSALTVGVPGSANETRIDQLESMQAELLLVYTERHPDVIAVQEQLNQLYEKRDEERAALVSSGTGMEGVANATNPVYQSAQIALNESGVRIAGLRSQINQYDAIVRQLNEQINTIPEVEAEFAELTRDYDQYRELYSEILMRRERERMGTIGDERDVVSFNVIDPPAAAFEPVSPRRTLLLVGVLILGLGAGGGLAFLLHQLNPVFYDVRTLNRVTERPVLGVLSMIWLERYKARRQIDITSFVVAGCSLFIAFIVILAFQDVGVQLMQSLIWEMMS